MNPTRMMAGTWSPTSETVGPSAAVIVYAGAIHEMPITMAPISPTEPALRPFLESPDADFVVVIVSILNCQHGVAGNHDHGDGQLTQHLRSGRAQKYMSRFCQPAGT